MLGKSGMTDRHRILVILITSLYIYSMGKKS
jgi:hypothetical protein